VPSPVPAPALAPAPAPAPAKQVPKWGECSYYRALSSRSM
jgi:hypothetical protein